MFYVNVLKYDFLVYVICMIERVVNYVMNFVLVVSGDVNDGSFCCVKFWFFNLLYIRGLV